LELCTDVGCFPPNIVGSLPTLPVTLNTVGEIVAVGANVGAIVG